MSNFKHLKTRIHSLSLTKKITKAMQMVSASKLQRLKSYANSVDTYSDMLANMMYDLAMSDQILNISDQNRKFFECMHQKDSAYIQDVNKTLGNERSDKLHLLVLITSMRGLCGGFNSAIVKYFKCDINEYLSKSQKVKLIIIGKKGYDMLKRDYSAFIEAYYPVNKDNCRLTIKTISNKLFSMIYNDECNGRCILYYNSFINAMKQVPGKHQMLPITRHQEIDEEENIKEANAFSRYEYEGSDIVEQIINLYISGMINYGLLQSMVGEEGARMAAMDNATRNADRLTDELRLRLNRSRQASITTELVEIISGAEVM